jgi:MFS family permease
VVVILFQPFLGRFSDKVGRRVPIVLGSVIAGLPLLVIPFSLQFPVLVLLSIVYGFGFATVTATTPALVSELVPSELVGTSLGFLSMIMDVGQTLGPIVTGIILATVYGYEGSFAALTIVLIAVGIIFGASQIGRKTSKA